MHTLPARPGQPCSRTLTRAQQETDQLWVVLTLEEYTATRGDELWTRSTTWLDPTDWDQRRQPLTRRAEGLHFYEVQEQARWRSVIQGCTPGRNSLERQGRGDPQGEGSDRFRGRDQEGDGGGS